MTPYHILAEAAKEHPEQSFLAVWHDFACWERARAYRDDPNAASKEDIDWIQTLYDLSVRLQERTGETRDCHNALEAAAAAFAGVDHEPQLYQGLVLWRKTRQQEAKEREQTPSNAES